MEWIANQWRLLRNVTPSPEQVKIGTTLTYVITERLRDILPSNEFDLDTDGSTIRITGVGLCRGNSYSTIPWLLLGLPGSDSERLERILKIYGRDVQKFLTKARHEPWPANGAESHVRVTLDTVDVWWGGSDESDAVVRLRTISRRELGI
jgi:hypothetical protein